MINDISAVPKVLLSCVGEDRPEWHRMMENLVLSLRRFGDGSSNIPVVVHVVGSAARQFTSSMSRLNAEVRVVDPVDRRSPSSNKLRMLELEHTDEFDVLLMLDCDIIVRGNVSAAADPSALRAAPAVGCPFTNMIWEQIYDDLSLPRPQAQTVMTITGEVTYPYYNGGVLFVPRPLCSPLLNAWNAARDRWFELTAERPDKYLSKHTGKSTIKQDQPPLSCAIASMGVAVSPLPHYLNLRTSGPKSVATYRHQWGPPFIFHYHNRIDNRGFLRPAADRRATPLLDEFNQARADWLRVAPPQGGIVRTLDTARLLGRNLKKSRSYRQALIGTQGGRG